MKKTIYMKPKTRRIALYDKEALLGSSVSNGTDPFIVDAGGGDQGAGRAKSAGFYY